MNIDFVKRGATLFLLIAAISAITAFSCSTVNSIRLGMSTKEVVEQLGEPDFRAILDGKLLRKIEEETEIDYNAYRVVYTYEATGIKIWFQEGKVSGATKKGITFLN